MLAPEAAKKQLEAWTIKNGDERLLASISILFPARLRTIGFELFGLGPQGEELELDYTYRYDPRMTVQDSPIDELSPRDRKKLFKVLCGPMAKFAEITCEFLKKQPYQTGFARRSFRAPKNPAATSVQRARFLRHFALLCASIRNKVLTVEWLAAWCPHLPYYSETICAPLFAAVMDAGGQEGETVFEVLRQSLTNEHEVGAMGRHVTSAMLGASREDGWELMEKTLLAAQRQEGLRQTILESVDQAHPDAFRRMLRIIVDEKLARFSAVARAVDVWLGMQWDSANVKTINDTCETLLKFLEQKQARDAALKGDDPERAFFALWAMAFDDVEPSITAAVKLAKNASPEMRFIAAYHLGQTQFPEALLQLLGPLHDADLRVAIQAVDGARQLAEHKTLTKSQQEKVFSALAELFDRCPPKPQRLPEIVWPWTQRDVDRPMIGGSMMANIGDLPPSRLLPYMQDFDPDLRACACDWLSERKKWDNETRETLVRLIGDVSPSVRSSAFAAFDNKKLTAAEAELAEGFLSRRASDLRQGVVKLLLKQSDKAALSSSQRLVSARTANQRLAGLEVLKELVESDRQRDQCLSVARGFHETRKKPTSDERTQLNAILSTGEEKVTLEDGLGLFDPADRSPRFTPKKRKVPAVTSATAKLLVDLDRLVHQHREEPVVLPDYDDGREQLLGNVRWGFPTPDVSAPVEPQLDQLPLRETWLKWERNRPKKLRDDDGCEFLRGQTMLLLTDSIAWAYSRDWYKPRARKPLRKHLLGRAKAPALKYGRLIRSLLVWLVGLRIGPRVTDVCQDIVETALALVPNADNQSLIELAQTGEPISDHFWHSDTIVDWRNQVAIESWLGRAATIAPSDGKGLTAEHNQRQWQFYRWYDEPVNGAFRNRPTTRNMMTAYTSGAATLADLMDHLIGPGQMSFDSLATFTRPRLDPDDTSILKSNPEIGEKLDEIRARILDVELARGDLPTAATVPAGRLCSVFGVSTLVRILSALGKERFRTEAYAWRQQTAGKASSFTHLVQICYPAPDDTAKDFKEQVKAAIRAKAFPEEKVMQLVFLAPQWTPFVQEYYGWEGLDEGLYWFLAHMNYVTGNAVEEAAHAAGHEDDAESDDETKSGQKRQKMSAWQRLVLERTPLSAADRAYGAVDVEWFHRTFVQLGKKRWQALAKAARFAATPAQAKRAQFIADVLQGNVDKRDLVTAIRERHLKEHVRLLGLLPLAKGRNREQDLRDRYEVLQEYKRYAKQLSSMSRSDAVFAAEIGLRNLSQLAGYRDPMRLEWAMEAEATKDLLQGPIVVAEGEVSMSLSLDDLAQPRIVISRGKKTLKSLPKTHKEEPAFVELRERNRELKRQASRLRGSLEEAMSRGDLFKGRELARIAGHALLKPMLERLVLVGEGIVGYVDKKGKALRRFDGNLEPIKKTEQLRIAHPSDLLATKMWHDWQHECFQAERLQPFKQVFRELYVVTSQERSDQTISRRYAGQQVNPQQAYALWSQRGWNSDDGVFKVFHSEGLTCSVNFDYGFTTPLEVEGLTLDTIRFYNRTHDLVPLEEIPPRIFSEVMRDLDLVVSVAHRGGVDPDASASTIEMRTTLLQETCQFLGIENVKLRKSHATITGKLGEYSVHLGSAVVHRMPGGAVCLVPVHAQHRGRLFLPFADDDPKTAELVSKVLLLARDEEIQDPTILEQIRGLAG